MSASEIYEIRVQPFEDTFECRGDESILTAALRQGRFFRYGCKNGGCGTCKVKLVDGDVDEPPSLLSLPPDERSDGYILACSSRPVDDCILDLQGMDVTEEEYRAGDRSTEYLAEVMHNRRLTQDIRTLRLRLIEPATMPFVAGQFVNIECPGNGSPRSYSMANSPSQADDLDFVVKILPGGRFSGACEHGLEPGHRLRMWGPFGQLRVKLSHRQILMIAGGSGMAPLLSMLSHLVEKGNERPVHFFFGARRPEDLYHLERIRGFVEAMPCLQFIPALSESWPDDWDGETGMITDAVARRLASLRNFDAYLCGPPAMIDAAIPLLIERGVRRQNIYFDAFLPTGTAGTRV